MEYNFQAEEDVQETSSEQLMVAVAFEFCQTEVTLVGMGITFTVGGLASGMRKFLFTTADLFPALSVEYMKIVQFPPVRQFDPAPPTLKTMLPLHMAVVVATVWPARELEAL